MSLPSTYKPSPLSFNSPRSSPFRRPSSPASPSTTIRPGTPTHVSTKPQTPSKLQNASTPPPRVPLEGAWTPSSQNLLSIAPREAPPSPSKSKSPEGADFLSANLVTPQITTSVASTAKTPANKPTIPSKIQNGDALAKLPQAQVREMREAFQVLDRDSDGQVNREDVADVLTNLGLDATPSSISPYFPPAAPQTMSLPTYLSNLSSVLAELSSPAELLAAFAAFDDDDSGQIDVNELRDALLHTSPEPGESALDERDVDAVMSGFVGRRAFGKAGITGKSNGGLGRSEIFRYVDFVGGLSCAGEGENNKSKA